jgi:translocator protein
MKKFLSFIFFLALVILIGRGGQIFTDTTVRDWYQTLQKPEGNPPDWVFAPVWTCLYILIAVSGWLIFIKRKTQIRAFVIYGAQLLFNLTWSFCFFFLKNPGLAFLDILVLLVLIILNILVFWKIYRVSGILLIPYLVWTLYAAGLNLAIWRLN